MKNHDEKRRETEALLKLAYGAGDSQAAKCFDELLKKLK